MVVLKEFYLGAVVIIALRLFLFMIGFGFAVAGGITIIAYLNIMTTGHGFLQYLLFMKGRPETYLFFSGISIIWVSIYFPFRR
ncbi:hypothetical protein EV207_10850 [Scopulibacillus darangshiensis]|uniref:Uncharacterized protein n=1 Tax=Scopulibacillus darangshiensis TaxID=442528 RepID=A0A4R2P6A6_9BACL|nr:hypothetical protein [Scopulibacillus darangshiensis]TCP29758.1 hypothetical protein EV207_10850 [Scopulibacillus darangshiensis]